MTTEELCTLIELRHKLKREISEEEFQAIRPLKSDPEKYDIDIVNEKIVKQYISCIYDCCFNDIEYYCEHFINNLKKKGYTIKSFRYLSYGGTPNVHSSWVRRFSVVFTNPN